MLSICFFPVSKHAHVHDHIHAPMRDSLCMYNLNSITIHAGFVVWFCLLLNIIS